MKPQFATSNTGRGGRRYKPYVFTEHGAIVAAGVLSSERTIQARIYVVRTFLLEALEAKNADARAANCVGGSYLSRHISMVMSSALTYSECQSTNKALQPFAWR